MNLANRLKRLEQRLGRTWPTSEQVFTRALAALRSEDLTSLISMEGLSDQASASGAATDGAFITEGTPETQEVLRRLELALDAAALEMTGKSYTELMRLEADSQRLREG